MNVKHFLTSKEETEIVEAIKQAELNTSGEIRVHLASRCRKSPLKKGLKVFRKLKMDQTEQKNGVLFFIAIKHKKIGIIADEGINNAVEDNFWDEVYASLKNSFQNEKYKEGLVKGILSTGEKLKQYFPYKSNDVNELSDEISKGR